VEGGVRVDVGRAWVLVGAEHLKLMWTAAG